MKRSSFLILLSLFTLHQFALAALTPEEDTLKVSRYLHPITDEQWKEIAGTQVEEQYEVISGDTLYDISNRLFGDPKYWPKIWALNNGKIKNPHVINPGDIVTFLPGTGTSLPSLQFGETEELEEKEEVDEDLPDLSDANMEWKKLPRQRWELATYQLPDNTDSQGFRKDNNISFQLSNGFDLNAFSASEKIPLLGHVAGAQIESNFLAQGDTIFIRADDELQIGEFYSITQDPTVLRSRYTDRHGYSYLNMGEVQVFGVRDNLFLAKIIKAYLPIHRECYVIPSVKRVPPLKPINATKPIEGIIIFDHHFSTYTTAQHKIVFIDKGENEGVLPGMVFRAYQHFDPSNDDELTTADFIIDADIVVLQTSEHFSTGLIINSNRIITENRTVVLLTDVSDILYNKGFRTQFPVGIRADSELDDLDKLDLGGNLSDEEKRTLKQLEYWRGNKTDDEIEGEDDYAEEEIDYEDEGESDEFADEEDDIIEDVAEDEDDDEIDEEENEEIAEDEEELKENEDISSENAEDDSEEDYEEDYDEDVITVIDEYGDEDEDNNEDQEDEEET